MTTLALFPEVLSGKRVLGLDNGKPGADVLLRRLAESRWRCGRRCARIPM